MTCSLGFTIGSTPGPSAESVGPYTTCYNRFVRWRRADIWSRIIDPLAAAHDAAVQTILRATDFRCALPPGPVLIGTHKTRQVRL